MEVAGGGRWRKRKKKEKKKKHIGMLEYLRNPRTVGTRSSKLLGIQTLL